MLVARTLTSAIEWERHLLAGYALRDVLWAELNLNEMQATSLAFRQLEQLQALHAPATSMPPANDPDAHGGDGEPGESEDAPASRPEHTIGFLSRARRKILTEIDLELIAQAAWRFERDPEGLSFAEHLRLMKPGPRFRDALRNAELVKAALAMPPDPMGPSVTVGLLRHEWRRVITRGDFARGGVTGEPSPSASELHRRLFNAARLTQGQLLSHRQLYRVVGHVWSAATGDKTAC